VDYCVESRQRPARRLGEKIMSREERKEHLFAKLRTAITGPSVINSIYRKAMEIPSGQMLTIGMTGDQMIEAILDKEYPRPPHSR
jgi:hypothetical protein